MDKRFKLLHQGRIDTVNVLRKLPATEHEPSSFKLDHVFFSVSLENNRLQSKSKLTVWLVSIFRFWLIENQPNSHSTIDLKPHMITFSVVGTFKEGKPTDKVRPIRSFERIFICIPDANT
jgi:hypothetical protein